MALDVQGYEQPITTPTVLLRGWQETTRELIHWAQQMHWYLRKERESETVTTICNGYAMERRHKFLPYIL